MSIINITVLNPAILQNLRNYNWEDDGTFDFEMIDRYDESIATLIMVGAAGAMSDCAYKALEEVFGYSAMTTPFPPKRNRLIKASRAWLRRIISGHQNSKHSM
ncbi:hypothetical protein M406DRAFT_331315 [Cryphonectria parasitica EP155]|uniref:Uncharacterized protein n=1 Tax=Cryphonectria parasitica (strain ATCC 38755 / EP155) TaxID=660469 RepID=A0A9P5CP43_CRYP1|nr:uncharacterized protein M406DRAFT_331315 [Cryphonectria parasitica EP155]KAF3765002.1 hypothetical protein M406DRAFT_331315 [Cryphonectria parasitica EP155]